MKQDNRFRMVSDLVEGTYQRFQTARCGACQWEDRLRDTTRNGAPPEMVKRKFQQRGWEMGQRPTDDECPKCVTKRKALSPSQKRAAWCAINNVPRAKEKKPVMAIETPRQPSIDDKRRIREALFDHYLEEKGCYAKAHSDKSVAAGLNVPSAWVTATREALGFGPDASEAAGAFTSEVLSIRSELRALQDDVLAQLANRCDVLEKRLVAVERAGYRGAA